MATKYTLTHIKLEEVFNRWNQSFLSSPEKYKRIDDIQCSEEQAKEFARLLNEVQKETKKADK